MAIDPHSDEDPIRAEGLRLLAEDPALAADLDDFERRLDAGQLRRGELVAHEEVVRTLREKGVLTSQDD